MKYSYVDATCVSVEVCSHIVAADSLCFHTVLVSLLDSVSSRTSTHTHLNSKGHTYTHTHTQFWQYNEPTSTVKVTTFIVLLWPVHGPSLLQTQLIWLCRQCSKSSSVKLGVLFSLLFSALPLFCLHSRQLLSRRASHFPQILFSPFLFAVSVVFVSLSHTEVKQVPLWSRTPPRAEFIGLSSVCVSVCLCMCVWVESEAKLWEESVLWEFRARGRGEEICVRDLFSWLPDRVGRVLGLGGRCKALSHPSTDGHWSAKSNDSLASRYATHIRIHANVTAACKQAHMRTLAGRPVTVITDWCHYGPQIKWLYLVQSISAEFKR